jgi:hypothetical protein
VALTWSYDFIAQLAPAVARSYAVRMLLGRSYMCGDLLLKPVGRRELEQAQALVAQYDVLLLLGREELNDLALQRGLGWPGASLRGVRLRDRE